MAALPGDDGLYHMGPLPFPGCFPDPSPARGVGVENIIENDAGCDLWRNADKENWLPVTRVAFDNCYNLRIRRLLSTFRGLFIAVANPFGPQVAVERDGSWRY